MEHPDNKNLKYGIIYLYSDRRYSPGLSDPEGIIKKFVHPLQVEWIDEPGREDLFLIARRFNVGSIGRYATVSLRLSRMNRSGGWFEAIRRFADALMGVSDADGGDIVITENLHQRDYYTSVFDDLSSCAPQDHTRVEEKIRQHRRFRLKRKQENAYPEEDNTCMTVGSPAPIQTANRYTEPDYLRLEEERELKRIERERERALERIKRDIVNYIAQYHEDPKELMQELLRGKVVVGQPGRILVNGDMKVVLPEYDEMEIEMPAMCRTLYILFLKQRKRGDEGIVLKNMDEHRDEIFDIYGLVKPGASEQRVKQTVNNLCDPLSDSLNQMISKINRCIKNVITDKELARDYCITGERGEQYGVTLDPQYLELPRAVTNLA